MEERKYLYKCPERSGNLNDMRLNNKWCDVTIRANKREFRAHKVILAANLKYFERIFSNDSIQESKEGVVAMDVIEEEDMEAFISYAYTGELLLTKNNALSFLEVANYLSESGVKEACVHFLNEHLRKEEACRAYQLATVLACPSLKNTAKAIITINFENCSNNIDYLNFDVESLMDILSDEKGQPIKQQQTLFEGIIRWIMYKASNRKIHVNDLLSLINTPTLTADFLIDCLARNIDRNDEHGIMRDTIFLYHTNKIVQKKSTKSLLIVDIYSDLHQPPHQPKTLFLENYDFIAKKWTSVHEAPGAIDEFPCSNSVVLNDKVYFINTNLGKCHLQVYDPSTAKITKLISSISIFEDAVIGACTKFLYLCGGVDTDDNVTNRVLRYDPLTNSFENLTAMKTRRCSALSIFCRGFLYILGGFDGSSSVHSVEKYDLHAKQWTAVAPMRSKRSVLCGVAALDEKLYICGGEINGRISSNVEMYDPVQNSWQSVASMNKPRDNLLVIAHEGMLLSIGGDKGSRGTSIEVYHPSKNQWQLDHEMAAEFQMKHPIAGWISSGSFL